MTAPIPQSDATQCIRAACSTAADGRRAARTLAAWCLRFEIGEPELQLLWRLHDIASDGIDQTTLAQQLAYSPAQVSGTVERLRARGWIVQQPTDGDRRRNLWRLSEAGFSALDQMLCMAHELNWSPPRPIEWTATAAPRQEAA